MLRLRMTWGAGGEGDGRWRCRSRLGGAHAGVDEGTE